jgi:hypothetical protein
MNRYYYLFFMNLKTDEFLVGWWSLVFGKCVDNIQVSTHVYKIEQNKTVSIIYFILK